jgi:dephospho-CoA kinase
MILFLTGSSGSGKTAIVEELRAGDPRGVYLHFDSAGVPSREAMIRDFGSGERWQAETTRRWIARIVAEHAAGTRVVIEGQSRPSFVRAALDEHAVARSSIILVHCDDDEREARLERRGQPELATAEMRSWSAFLLREARARKLPILDTTRLTIADAANRSLTLAAW